MPSSVRLHGGARPISLEQHRLQTRKRATPILEFFCGSTSPTLIKTPSRIVHVANRQGLQLRLLTLSQSGIKNFQFAQQDSHRPTVRGDGMNREYKPSWLSLLKKQESAHGQLGIQTERL